MTDDSLLRDDEGRYEAMMWDNDPDSFEEFRHWLEPMGGGVGRLPHEPKNPLFADAPGGNRWRLLPNWWLVRFYEHEVSGRKVAERWKVYNEAEMLVLVSGPHRCAADLRRFR